MRKNAEKMDLSSRNRLLRVPAGSHGFWAHDPLPDPSHDPDIDSWRVTIPLAFTTRYTLRTTLCMIKCHKRSKRAKNDQKWYFVHRFLHKQDVF